MTKTFKKIIIAVATLASSASFALHNPAPYVGAGLGITTNTSSYGYSYRGMPVNLFAGYGGVINQNVYLAGEVGATLGTGDINHHGLKTSRGYGASVVPGVMLSDHTLAFLRAGVVRSHFTSQNADSTGAQIGVGMQTSLTQNVDVRGEFDYVSYRSINDTTSSGIRYALSPRSDQFSLGLVYKLD